MSRTWTILTTAALLLAPLALAQNTVALHGVNVPDNDPDMQRAVRFERAKDRADLRQAKKERRHPTVSYHGSADRRAPEPNAVKDLGERRWQKR